MEKDYFHSVVLRPERCAGCTYCLKICPTEAIRLKSGMASIIPERCIDCGECIRVCPNHAKTAVTDGLEILKQLKYTIALTIPTLYGQYNSNRNPRKVMSSLKSLGFNEVWDTSIGSEIFDVVGRRVLESRQVKPVINSSCPAVVRLIQFRFPELLENIIDIETPVEITAIWVKLRASKNTGLPLKDIGIVLITPCTARVTSNRKPIGIPYSYINGTISMKDIYGPVLKAFSNEDAVSQDINEPTRRGALWYSTGGQMSWLRGENTLAVDGINNVISVLEEVEMGKFNNLSYLQLTACPGSCLGGPLVVKNRYIALNNLMSISSKLNNFYPSEKEISSYYELYDSGIIKLTEKIKPKSILSLDSDIKKSIEKLDNIRTIAAGLPGINCGICGAPTCHAFAEDLVMGNRDDSMCPVMKIIEKYEDNKDGEK